MGNPKVAFICVHNSCRNQIAEALGKAQCMPPSSRSGKALAFWP